MSHIQTAAPLVQNCALQVPELCSGAVLSCTHCSVSLPGDFRELRRQFMRKHSGMVIMNGIKDSGSGNQSEKGPS